MEYRMRGISIGKLRFLRDAVLYIIWIFQENTDCDVEGSGRISVEGRKP